ncbi:Kelch repeat-containing protein [Polaribacter glomeratus]|uniref:Galactose oxidase n=1 Tax=Polaribacter glomeratus TaxID=102 RepID=A0A2S7WHM7_9FLAO|nr:hypothetical protein [Polaribacter glomeratus]PQJ76811.1 hypothetical protein BTO16_13125 [Polaribacter glomeratus]TXD67347.1 hypothetical protein ESX12_01790 [Polaribacter glomeratus]
MKVLSSSTQEAIEKAHVFFRDEAIYTDENGAFLVDLQNQKSISIRITHLKYENQETVFKISDSSLIIYLDEREEQLNAIKINAKRKLKNTIDFKKLEELPKAVYSFGSVINEGKIYVFGGDVSSEYEKNKEGMSQLQVSSQAEIMKFLTKPKPISFNNFLGDIQFYDTKQKKWQIEKDRIIKRAYHKAVFYNDTVMLIGGKIQSKKKSRELLANQIEHVSLKDLFIENDETNPHQAVDFGAALYEDKLLVFGGSIKQNENKSLNFSDEIHFYDLKTGYWYLLTKMTQGKEVTGIVFDQKLYLFGGFNKKNLAEIESFNLITGMWKTEGALFRGMKKPSITKDNEFIYLQEDGKMVTFEPKTSILKEYKIDLNLKEANMHFFNENLYLIGGYQVEDYRKAPSNGFYSIEASEFFKTKPIRVKTLNTVN